jgi:hypothetical protein
MPTVLGLAGLSIPESVEGVNRIHPGARSPKTDADASLLMLPAPITEARRYGFAEYCGLYKEVHVPVGQYRSAWGDWKSTD